MRRLGWLLTIAGILGLVYACGARSPFSRRTADTSDCVHAWNHGSDHGVPRADGALRRQLRRALAPIASW